MSLPRFIALIPAAGVGSRMGASVPKQYAWLAGKPMIQHVMQTFSGSPLIDAVYVVVSDDDDYIAGLPQMPRTRILRCGGATRHESVTNGLRAIQQEVDPDDWVLVHDAARPGLTQELIEKLIAFVKDDPVGGLLAVPVVGYLVSTLAFLLAGCWLLKFERRTSLLLAVSLSFIMWVIFVQILKVYFGHSWLF